MLHGIKMIWIYEKQCICLQCQNKYVGSHKNPFCKCIVTSNKELHDVWGNGNVPKSYLNPDGLF